MWGRTEALEWSKLENGSRGISEVLQGKELWAKGSRIEFRRGNV
jgi:hypothetical protein